jgi:TPR repeat protein
MPNQPIQIRRPTAQRPPPKKRSLFLVLIAIAGLVLFVMISFAPNKPSQGVDDSVAPPKQAAQSQTLAKPQALSENNVTSARETEQATAETQYKWGLQYATGKGTPKDDRSAAIWWLKAAEQGHLKAQVNLAWAYENGVGVGRDPSNAAYWYTKAAEQNDAIAQYRLGYMSEEGSGLEKNMATAVEWYRKSAAQGYAEAKTSLGLMYLKGSDNNLNEIASAGVAAPYTNKRSGIIKDELEALLLFQEAAKLGDSNAQYHLSSMYANGIATTKDEVQSYFWLIVSSEKGNKSAKAMLEKLATRLSPEQRAQAEANAKNWKAEL